MLDDVIAKVIIVEGLTDKVRIEKIITEQLEIICTNGTLGLGKIDEIIEEYDLDHKDVFIFVDEDVSGHKLRKLLKRELPHAIHMHISKDYREVAKTPMKVLATILSSNHIQIDPVYLI